MNDTGDKTETTFVAGYLAGCLAGYLTYIIFLGTFYAPPSQRFTLSGGHFGVFAILLPFATILASIVVLPAYMLVRFAIGRRAFSSLPNACGFGIVCAMLSIPLATWIGIHSDFDGFQPYLPHLVSAFSQSPAYIGAGLFSGGNPNVWISNNYTNTGNLLGQYSVSCATPGAATCSPALLNVNFNQVNPVALAGNTALVAWKDNDTAVGIRSE